MWKITQYLTALFVVVLCIHGNMRGNEPAGSQTARNERTDDSGIDPSVLKVRIGDVSIGLSLTDKVAILAGIPGESTPRWTSGISILLASYPDIENIDVHDVFICDDALVALKGLPKLRRISMLSTNFSDDHLLTISRIKSVEEIVIYAGNLTDVAIPILGSMRNLKLIAIEHNRLFPLKGFQLLRKLLPNTQLGIEGEEFVPVNASKQKSVTPSSAP